MLILSEFEHNMGIPGDACLMEIDSHDNADKFRGTFNENVISEILTKKLYCTRLCNKGAHSSCVAVCRIYTVHRVRHFEKDWAVFLK